MLAILNWGEVIEFKLCDIRKNIKERGVSLRHCHRTITLPCSTLCPSFKYFVIHLGELVQNVARSSLLALLVKSPLKRVLALHSDLFLRLMKTFVTSQHFTMVRYYRTRNCHHFYACPRQGSRPLLKSHQNWSSPTWAVLEYFALLTTSNCRDSRIISAPTVTFAHALDHDNALGCT